MKKIISVAGALGLLFGAMSLQASAAPKPQITDPVGDANFVNDQGTGDGSFGDQTAADAGTVSDLEAVTFSNDAKNLVLVLQTEAAPPATTGIGFRVRVNPGDDGSYCLRFEAYYPGANNTLTAAEAYFFDDCEGTGPTPIEVLGQQLTIPRKLSKAFAKGAKLTAPQAQSFLYTGSSSPAGAPTGYADTTLVGTDFAFKK